jgi:hypothetical protein
MAEEMPNLAYYYPAPYWLSGETDRLKNLLLFFDGIAILLPRYMAGRERAADPFLADPLREMGLLTVLEPETFVGQSVTEALITTLTELITGGAFNTLDCSKHSYQELSYSRLGSYGDPALSKMILDELIRRNLARPSKDGVSVPMHPVVRTTILVLLAQLARDAGRRMGLGLHPATTNRRAIQDLLSVLSLPASPSAGHLVTLDLETVGVNLTAVPLDDILDFREHHGLAYRTYARSVREKVSELGLLEPEEREVALLDRRNELRDMAEDLRNTAQRRWRNPAGLFALSAAGAGWIAQHGHDPIGAVLALAAAGWTLAGTSLLRSASLAARPPMIDNHVGVMDNGDNR